MNTEFEKFFKAYCFQHSIQVDSSPLYTVLKQHMENAYYAGWIKGDFEGRKYGAIPF